MKAFLDVILLQHGIFELHFRVLLVELLPDRRIAHRRAPRDHRLQLVHNNFLAHIFFKHRGRKVGSLQHPRIFGLSDEVSVRKKDCRVAAVLQFVLDFLRCSLQSHMLRFAQQRLTINQLVGGSRRILLNQKWNQHRRVRAILLRLLLRHLARRLLHLLNGDIFTAHFGYDALARRTRQFAAQSAWNKCNYHRGANQQQQPAEHNFLDRSFSLQESNHLLITPEFRCGTSNYKPVELCRTAGPPANELLKRINRRVIPLISRIEFARETSAVPLTGKKSIRRGRRMKIANRWILSLLFITKFSVLLFLGTQPLWADSASQPAHKPRSEKLLLSDSWNLQSSAKVDAKGEIISTTRFIPKGWHSARVPTTVVAALVKDKTLPDPFFAMNLREFPGMTYPIG